MREKTHVTQTILEIQSNNVLKWNGRLVRMEDSRLPNKIMSWSPEQRRRRGQSEVSTKRKWKGLCETEQIKM
jgi:hypothetical protein